MRNLVIALSLTVALLAGCLIGATASRLIVPPVRAGTSPQKWEHKCITSRGTAKSNERDANRLGRAGIELTAIGIRYFCFKRRMP